jgi:hypothetical protein
VAVRLRLHARPDARGEPRRSCAPCLTPAGGAAAQRVHQGCSQTLAVPLPPPLPPISPRGAPP